jgi:hypothetical protein
MCLSNIIGLAVIVILESILQEQKHTMVAPLSMPN